MWWKNAKEFKRGILKIPTISTKISLKLKIIEQFKQNNNIAKTTISLRLIKYLAALTKITRDHFKVSRDYFVRKNFMEWSL